MPGALQPANSARPTASEAGNHRRSELSQVMPPRAGRARVRDARSERSWSGKYLQTALSPKKSEDDIQREQLGPGGVPGAPDPAKMTPPREKKTPEAHRPGSHGLEWLAAGI